ncbi:cob(I)yrinic acid a,c-diamide adenosyltransferase [Thalassoporum mexicanum PCC 7367]|uniref:cob(I)yrinic acid a,c-diamide adenosyltransferase n=1 Tax=Thalassoporum mexicanum TaxID=3457544 RepID=UPI00029FEC58|nr:cob(I)yrinic acid a,c-diamide adenosyltransferase [Pseudanabaena sp. PCC 7367]AFY68515.1 cob(I)yrinic acid a,c-diamide adenosyltransferase [Pseudanabaena sp. PCC 7367]
MVAEIKNTQPSKKSQKTRKVTLTVVPQKGTIQIFTAPQTRFYGKVVAQALNHAGHGTKVLIAQMFQGGIRQGTQSPRQLAQTLDWLRCDLARNIDPTTELTKPEIEAVQNLWQFVKTAIANGEHGLILLDELNMAIPLGVIDEAEIIATISNRPDHVDVILTGANMPDSLLEIADQVTKRRS